MNDQENRRGGPRLPDASDRFTDAILDGGARIRRHERRRRAASRLAAAAAALIVGLALLAHAQRAPRPDNVLRAVHPDSRPAQAAETPTTAPSATATPEPQAPHGEPAGERFLQVVADDGTTEPASLALLYERADPASRKVGIPGGTLVERLGAALDDMVRVRYASAEGYMRRENLALLQGTVRLFIAEEGAPLFAGPEEDARTLTRLAGGVPVDCGAASAAVGGRVPVIYGGLAGWTELDDLRLLPAGAAILGATLIWPGGTGEIQEQSLGATELETLSELLRGARPGAAGDCPYGGQLTVRLDGESLRLARPLDGCGTLIADDGAVFVLEPGSEAAFWTLFDEAAENLRLQREG